MRWSPIKYAEASVIARTAGEEMMARLEWITLKPKCILDIGCGTGEVSALLKAHYPEALVIAMDSCELMVEQAMQHSSLNCICANADYLPLKAQSVDLICANLLLPWHDNFKQLFAEWRRVLRTDGLLMFSALGPDTLREWRHLFPAEDLPRMLDMHDVGDILVQEKFADPVLDIDYYTVNYRQSTQLVEELCATGMLAKTVESYNVEMMLPASDGKWPVTYEIVYAHAWMPPQDDGYSADSEGVTSIPLAALRRSLRGK